MPDNNDKFWADSTLEPKRKHRWLMTVESIPAFVIKVAKKPGLTINKVTHEYYGHSFYYPGKTNWEPIDITLVDPVDPDVSDRILNLILERSGYVTPDVKVGDQPYTMSKAESVKALGFQITLQQMGPGSVLASDPGLPIETWTLHNPWIGKVTFGDLSYADDGMVEIGLTLNYDYAKLSV